MKIKDNKGFTLVELIATIVILSLVVGIASVSVITIINNAKEKEMNLLIAEIKSGATLFYQECNYDNNMSVCDDVTSYSGGKTYYTVTLGNLVQYGYLKGNASDNSDDKFVLVNPSNNAKISACKIKYTYSDGDLVFVNAGNTDSNCPLVR